MVASDSFADFLREQLAPVRPRSNAAYVRQDRRFLRGLMFGMMTDNIALPPS